MNFNSSGISRVSMNPRMKESGTPVQPQNEFQIRNPWIPQTPGSQIHPRSNGISTDRNGNQLGKRNWSEFFELLDRHSKETPNSNRAVNNFNQSSGNRGNLTRPLNHQIGNGIFQGGANINVNWQMNQVISSNSMIDQRMGNGISQGDTNFDLNGQMNQIISSNSMVDHQMENGNLGHYRHYQTQTNYGDTPSWRSNSMTSNRVPMGNAVHQPSFHATNMASNINTRTDPVMSPLMNLNTQPLSLPRGINQMNSAPDPSILNAYSEVDSSWTQGNFTSLLLGDEIPTVNKNKWINSNNSPHMLNNGFHVPVQHNYNLNSAPISGGNAGTSNANSFPFTPITPDHRNLIEKHRQAEMLKFLVDDGPCQEHDKMENLISSIGNEAIENQCSELLQTIVDSSTVVSTPQGENEISERGVNDIIDLSETPKQKTPKRRKHRPKVVIEGKSKRTPKMKTPKNGESEETPSKKRKYVRKNRDPQVESVTPQHTNVINTNKVPNSESREESCRKRLNFEFGNTEKGESQYMASQIQVAHYQGNQPVLDLNLNLNFPANQMPVESLDGEESSSLAVKSGIVSNTLNVIARNLSFKGNEKRENLNKEGDLNKSISRPNINLEKAKDVKWKSTHQMVERDVGNFKGFYGIDERDSHPTEQSGPSSDPKLSSPSMCLEPIQSKNQGTINPTVGTSSEETLEKQKMENEIQTVLCRPEKRRVSDGTSGENTINGDNYMQRKLTALKRQIALERVRERMSSRSNQVHRTGYPALMTNSNQQSAISASKNVDVFGYQQQAENYQAGMQNNGLDVIANQCRIVSFCTNKVPLGVPKDNLHQYRLPSMTGRGTTGSPKSVKYTKKMVDEITFRLQSLSIKGENGETDGKDKYALVPYGGGSVMVPYEPKKRKPRPKVDLDPETTRIWKLLMGKEGTEAYGAENKDKEKWWEEERRVFQGRADSFIARMHLVQGDRRFSPWKGSVVDSIIGVFLTQNVSDQLSSSAFMALAAQFPLGVATPDQTSDHSGTSILTEELEIQGLAQSGTIGCFDKIIRQPFLSQNSPEFSINHINGENQCTSGSSSEAEDSSNRGKSIKNKDLTSVQHVNSTAPLQVVENHENGRLCFDNRSMRFYKQSSGFGNNCQIPGLVDGFNNLNSFPPSKQPVSSNITNMQNSALPPSFFQLLMAPQVARSELDCSEILREEFRSLPLSAPEMTKGKGMGYQENRVRHTEEMMSNNLFQQNGFQKSQTPNIDPFHFLMKDQTVQNYSENHGPQIGKEPLPINTHQEKRSQVYRPEHRGYENPTGPVEPAIAMKSGSGDHVPNVPRHTQPIFDIQEGTTAANKQVLLGQRSSDGHAKGETNTGTSTKTLNTSLKHEKEKREAFDWDSLRKMAQPNGRGQERSMDALDSMDYEAMRCVDVNVISDSIRIRGMNNMLSERIQDFLNRVVRDHGSVDLEWLRDVPPDRAKDYLLSIRGLGLKSVECVRLLTLHHLAFPVDTNVGRIAVRLGWVPLQPLPESLQLHLLEMYPVLESVQKYLWPRLCKLDQKTLYELHYQLITFGKVFCTKSKPNCNACPMRGECRHFASAFASARLALPAPEEKGLVGSTMPIATDRRADVAIKPLLLQPSCSNGERELMVSRCEPIIEEPATPEPEITDIAETDIEDAFYEDPDEIPTIKLNVEQLAVNLRNFMEEHTDLQEGDMSKALVALTPEVASIPVPKLKYVLRLRTERQVYVLPDTHPLVKELDNREPDDPSPYLLALLAPGEEPGSGQAYGKCGEANGSGEQCKEKECSPVNGEENSLTVRGTLLIPCRTAMRGSFPLNGTYFQVNEVFADHESSLKPIDVPRAWLWHLETRTVLFGTSATSIFRGMATKEIQSSFWRGFVCVRGFDRKTRAPRPLNRNLHIPHSKTIKTSNAT